MVSESNHGDSDHGQSNSGDRESQGDCAGHVRGKGTHEVHDAATIPPRLAASDEPANTMLPGGSTADEQIVHEAMTIAPKGVPDAASPVARSIDSQQAASTFLPPEGYRRFGDYELLGEIARGGMGVVYKARQIGLNRTVAIKMILAGQFASKADVQRFYTEAEAAANLTHPNIVAIHEVGECEGQHFFSMEYIEGVSLGALVAKQPLPPRHAAWYVQTIAGAIHYAHQHGILHRDLKPSNVLIQQREASVVHEQRSSSSSFVFRAEENLGIPKVTDFGLAKRIEGGSQITASGVTLGTPSYMPPEQAGAKLGEIGPTSDVYSIGAILYQLITGRAPFEAATPLDTILQVIDNEPIAPRLLNRAIDRDLQTICLKCLQKSPRARYATAQDLADDLGRYQAGEPISARPVGNTERLLRWCRRNRAVSGLIALVLFMLVAAAVGGFVSARTERVLRSEAEAAKQTAQARAIESNYRLVRQYVADGMRLLDEGDLIGSLPRFVEALNLDAGDPDREQVHRARIAAVLKQAPKPTQIWFHDGPVLCANFSSDGQRIVTASGDATARIWDTQTGAAVGMPLRHDAAVHWAMFGPQPDRVLTASADGTVRVWNSNTGERVGSIMRHQAAVTRATFNREGNLIATASQDKTARVWYAATGEPVTPPLEHTHGVTSVAFSPDGQFLATGSGEHSASHFIAGQGRLWNARTGKLVHMLTHDANVGSVSFSPDGASLITAGEDHMAKVWDTATGQLKTSGLRHEDLISHAVFSPDGRRVVTASDDDTAKVWDATTGEILTPVLKHRGEVRWVSMSPDGRFAATAGYYGTAQVWNVSNGEPVVARLQHAAPVVQVEFSPDGRRIVTASEDGTARLWDFAAGEIVPMLLAQNGRLRVAVFSDDGRQIITGGDDNTVRLWDAQTGKQLLAPLEHKARVQHASFSPNGRWVVSASDDGTAQVWNVGNGQRHLPAFEHAGPVMRAMFSADSQKVVTASLDHTARVWDAVHGGPIAPPLTHDSGVAIARFSPDGHYVVTGSQDGTVRVWNATTGEPSRPPLRLGYPVRDAAFSPDGTKILTVAGEELMATGSAEIWDARSGQRVTPPLKHRHAVADAAWSFDSKWVVTASFDDTARVWDANTGEARTPPMTHKGDVWWAWFSHDGSRILTSSADSTARVWDSSTGEAISPPFRHFIWCTSAVFSPDGRRIVTTSRDSTARVWELPSDDRPVPEFVALAELLSGYRLSASDFVKLTPEEFKSEWVANHALFAADFTVSTEQAIAWHRREATDCAIAGQWFGRAWQVNKRIEMEGAKPGLVAERARCHAELGHWESAARDFEFVHGLGVADPEHDYKHALLCLGQHDEVGYRQICERLAMSLGQMTDGNAINSTVWTCVLHPNSVSDYSPLVEASRKLLEGRSNNAALLNTMGTAYYRAGALDEAATALEAAVQSAQGEGTAWDWLFLAMTQHRRGHIEDARQWYDRALEWIRRETGPKTRGALGERLTWEQRLELRLLQDEVEQMLATP
jgi:WD40 repeat protein/serine/threonine protein kinase